MPNICNNKLSIKGNKDVIKKMLADIAGEPDGDGNPRHIDFDKIIPMPKVLKNTSCGPRKIDGVIVHGSFFVSGDVGSPDFIMRSFTDEERNEIEKLDFHNWYDWRCVNWGTKWNAFSTSLEYLHDNHALITFDTAWCPPREILQALWAMYPELKFGLKYMCEDDMRYKTYYHSNTTYQERKEFQLALQNL